jgi:hypothetical protein
MVIKRYACFLGLGVLLGLLMLTGCAPAMESEPAAEVETVIVEKEVESVVETVGDLPTTAEPAASEPEAEGPVATHTLQPQPTAVPASPTPGATLPLPTSTPVIEPRVVEVEWPQNLYLGDSDVVRMAIIPTKGGYSLTTEFPDHKTITQDVPVIRPEGYELLGVARLDGVGFEIAPSGDQVRSLPLEETVIWHWSLTPEQPGRQRITLTLLLRWVPLSGSKDIIREAVVYSKGLEIRVRSFFGLTRGQAMTTGLFGAIFGSGLSLYTLIFRPAGVGKKDKPQKIALSTVEPNLMLAIESPPELQLSDQENSLLRSLFSRYVRLVVQSEFLSGYSGARTFLILPIRADGRSDAFTIAKIGERDSIQREFKNYEAFVKHTLPPITARIQHPPVTVRGNPKAALQYTFIGEAGSQPTSLREVLLESANPSLLSRIFETFGPNWWMQRKPHTFWLAEEYDRTLPPHYVIEPSAGGGLRLDGRTPPAKIPLTSGSSVTLQNIVSADLRHDGVSYDLRWESTPGHPALRVRWLGDNLPKQPVGRVVANREDLLRSTAAGFDLSDYPDPIRALPRFLNESVTGSRSIIHGDLNLENVLVGPGGMVWLIDFATTREGHPMFDFAHLEVEIISHIIAPQVSTSEYLELLKSSTRFLAQSRHGDGVSGSQQTLQPDVMRLLLLIESVRDFAAKCLANPSKPREYHLALYVSCLGALKYRNLNPHQKHLLLLTAASLMAALKN